MAVKATLAKCILMVHPPHPPEAKARHLKWRENRPKGEKEKNRAKRHCDCEGEVWTHRLLPPRCDFLRRADNSLQRIYTGGGEGSNAINHGPEVEG